MENVANAPALSRLPAWKAYFSLWVPLVLYAATMCFFSSRPATSLPRWAFITEHDKILHAIEYMGLGMLIVRALLRSGMRLRWSITLSIGISLVFGVFDEWHQSFVPGRRGNDIGDLSADVSGALLGTLVVVMLWLRFYRGKYRANPAEQGKP